MWSEEIEKQFELTMKSRIEIEELLDSIDGAILYILNTNSKERQTKK